MGQIGFGGTELVPAFYRAGRRWGGPAV